jgi:hypothetical protein
MPAVRAFSLLLSASAGFVFGGCGSSSSGPSPAGHVTVPPIQSIQRTLPASSFGVDVAFIRSGCLSVPVGPGLGAPRRCQPGREDISGRPKSPDTVVHLIARLPLTRPAPLSKEAFFAVYRSEASGTCFSVVFRIPTDALDCDGNDRCAAVCIRSVPERRAPSLASPGTPTYMLVAGTVPLRGKALRLTFPGGKTVTYALRGPAAGGFPGRRVFMADVGRLPKPSRVELVG